MVLFHCLNNTVTVTDNKKNPLDDVSVIVKGDKDRESGKTDEDGKLIVPEIQRREKHGSYIYGYGDGSFRADDFISRAEVVTIVNRLLDRTADEDYIADNMRSLNVFPDVSKKHWAYLDVLEAANGHTAVFDDGKEWRK